MEIKAPGAGRVALDLLERSGFAPAALGSFDSAEVADMAEAGSAWPLSVLVRTGEDPIARAAEAKADIAHLCWENASDRPQDLVTPALLEQLRKADLGLVLWHEERPQVLEVLVSLPALGICTDQPELLGGFHAGWATGMEIVCHRGINHIAPENTRAAALLAYDLGADWLELDVRETADHEIVVLHDPTLDRTTNGHGLVSQHTLAQLRALDAGSWKAPRYADERLQTLGEAIALCQARDRRMYIENKAVDPARLLAEVDAYGFLEDCFFWSPDMQILREIRRLSPTARIKSNISHHDGFEAMQRDLAPQICEIQVDDWETEAPMCRELGITPMLIYFGVDPEIFSRIGAWRPEMVNLDRADMFLAAIRRLGAAR